MHADAMPDADRATLARPADVAARLVSLDPQRRESVAQRIAPSSLERQRSVRDEAGDRRPRSVRELRILVVDAMRRSRRRARASVPCASLPDLLRAGDLVVVNDAATLPARCAARTASGRARSSCASSARRMLRRQRARLHGGAARQRRLPHATEHRPPPPRGRAGRHPHARRRLVAHVDALSVLSTVSFTSSSRCASRSRSLANMGRALPRRPARAVCTRAGSRSRSGTCRTPRRRGRGRSRCRRRAARSTSRTLLALRRARHRGRARHPRGRPVGDGRPGDRRALPLPERYEVARGHGARGDRAKARGGRVIAIGTSVVRALESAASAASRVSRAWGRALRAASGVTDLLLGPETERAVVDAVLTGVHESDTTHFTLLKAFADRATLDDALASAVSRGAPRPRVRRRMARLGSACVARVARASTPLAPRRCRSCAVRLRCYSRGVKFVHAADLHIDSPLRGLDRVRGRAGRAPARRHATRAREPRRALHRGASGVPPPRRRRLRRRAGRTTPPASSSPRRWRACARRTIPVVIVRGNHDAASSVTQGAASARQRARARRRRSPRRIELDDAGVAVHGQSFAQRATTDDLAARYPDARAAARFNIGLLHTCVDGREGHEPLRARRRSRRCARRATTTGRSATCTRARCSRPSRGSSSPATSRGGTRSETGPKGASVVTVDGNVVQSVEHRALDVVRWELLVRSTRASRDRRARGRRSRRATRSPKHGRGVDGSRARGAGRRAGQHARQRRDPHAIGALRQRAPRRGDRRARRRPSWLEKMVVQHARDRSTSIGSARRRAPIGHLARRLAAIKADPKELAELVAVLAELDKKLPAELREGEGALVSREPATLRAIARRRRADAPAAPPRGADAVRRRSADAPRRSSSSSRTGRFAGSRSTSPRPGLHVVLGRNEAGKSTTLRAITGLLYGIDTKTPDAHVHKFGDLRIGGVLDDGARPRASASCVARAARTRCSTSAGRPSTRA